jgi:16S rRNA (guanine527-N7)-methyltransferase
LDDRARGELILLLGRAQERGFVGPGTLDAHVDRALDLMVVLDQEFIRWAVDGGEPRLRALDLGSGGGLPGLPLALALPETRWVLLDGSTTRAAFLTDEVNRLGLQDRVDVVADRAEVAGRGALRASFDLVVSRSFGAPAVTVECAAPLLRVGGKLVVAEPPGGQPDRWPAEGLARLGMVLGGRESQPTAVQVMIQSTFCPDAYPRRTGVPSRRPLF